MTLSSYNFSPACRSSTSVACSMRRVYVHLSVSIMQYPLAGDRLMHFVQVEDCERGGQL